MLGLRRLGWAALRMLGLRRLGWAALRMRGLCGLGCFENAWIAEAGLDILR